MWLAVVLALSTPTLASDTVVRVDRGTRLTVENHQGEVVITAWDRDEVQILAELSGRQELEVERAGAVVRVRPRPQGGHRDAEFRIAVPRWMPVRIEGNNVDVDVRGTESEVSVETVGGDILIDGGAGVVAVRTIQGEVMVRNAMGRIEVVSVNEDVQLEDIGGDVLADATNGDIVMRRIRSTVARATTVNGDISYDGTLRDNGRYTLSTHNGDVTITVPAEANATVTVGTYHGEFVSDFPVRLSGTSRDRRFDFTLGSGSARIELESFNGEIRLRRP